MPTRRTLLKTLLAATAIPLPWPAAAAAPDLHAALAAIERDSGGRLGVSMLRTADGTRVDYRGHEAFPLCSTFKVLAAAAILKRCDVGKERLDRRVRFGAADVVAHSPVTGPRIGGGGMTLAELCHAAITQSDNTAANLLLKALGGPAAITRFAAALGDRSTRLDRRETALNESLPGDPRDTTTPSAMLDDLRQLLLGDRLSVASRDQLETWLVANRTGALRLRAGLPPNWRVGDKTGSGDRGSTNDIAIVRPPAGPPLLVTVYLTGTAAAMPVRDAAIAAVGDLLARSL